MYGLIGYSLTFDILDYFILQLFDIRIYLFIVQSLINLYKNSGYIKTDFLIDIFKSIFVMSHQSVYSLVDLSRHKFSTSRVGLGTRNTHFAEWVWMYFAGRNGTLNPRYIYG